MQDLIAHLPVWMPVNALYFFIAGCAGLFAHYISKRGRGEIAVNLYAYLFVDHPGWTLSTLLAIVAADFAAVAGLGLEDAKMSVAVASGFTAGWACDSACAPHVDRDDHDERRDDDGQKN